MAKKKKIVIKDEELMPTVIGIIDTRQAGLIYLIFVFIILGGFVYFLPQIDVFIKSKATTDTLVETPQIQNDDLTYIKGMNIVKEEIKLSNIVIDNEKITFDIENLSDRSFNFEKEYLYLESYDYDDNLVSRINFSGITVSSGGTHKFKSSISSEDVSYFKFETITENQYPEVVLNKDEADVQNLVCIKGDEVITYEFNKNSLNTIINKTYIKESEVEKYGKLASEYNKNEGIKASVEDEFDFYFTYKINLKIFDDELDEDIYYKYKTDAKVISFEMISNGYECN